MGRWTPLEEIDQRLQIKISKILTQVGAQRLKQSGKTRAAWREEIYERLKKGRVYQLDPDKKLVSAAPAASPAVAAV